MVWWVYQQVKKCPTLESVYVAVDDERVQSVCEQFDIPIIMTSPDHKSHINRLYEVSTKLDADIYVCVCGDEPLTQYQTIESVIPQNSEVESFIARSLMREINDPAETVDPSNLKVVTDKDGYGILVTRSIVPFPYKSTKFKYKKVVGIECYNKPALDFFVNAPIGMLEKIEDTNLLRFIEQRKPFKFIMTDAYQLSVDTQSDLDKVREIVNDMLQSGTLSIKEMDE